MIFERNFANVSGLTIVIISNMQESVKDASFIVGTLFLNSASESVSEI